jgi:hypothetical protein
VNWCGHVQSWFSGFCHAHGRGLPAVAVVGPKQKKEHACETEKEKTESTGPPWPLGVQSTCDTNKEKG